ncbi:MAG TPA: hypothetical protein VGW80_12805 [Solirubrobacterales bacterium]|jgi:hypothetical protein|nr:hypothetical protein [Solirubrobacterales bacterium]
MPLVGMTDLVSWVNILSFTSSGSHCLFRGHASARELTLKIFFVRATRA